MNDEMMDPLEWTVRKVVPIPKAYYWDTGNHDLPLSIKMWHRSIAFLGKSVRAVECAGEKVATTTGLNNWSRFSYVLDTMTPEEREVARQINEERRASIRDHQATVEAAAGVGVKPDVI